MSFEFKLSAGLALLAYYNKVDGRFVEFLQKIPKNQNERFYNTYDLSKFGRISDEDIDRLLFSIVKLRARSRDGDTIEEYYTFEDNDVAGTSTQNYSTSEIEFFRSRYAPAQPENQVDLTPPAGNFNSSQAVIENNGMQYNSLSSLGEFAQEDFIVTATTGSATELITTATEQISDAGGTISRDREITSTGGLSGTGTTVTTSGY